MKIYCVWTRYIGNIWIIYSIFWYSLHSVWCFVMINIYYKFLLATLANVLYTINKYQQQQPLKKFTYIFFCQLYIWIFLLKYTVYEYSTFKNAIIYTVYDLEQYILEICFYIMEFCGLIILVHGKGDIWLLSISEK